MENFIHGCHVISIFRLSDPHNASYLHSGPYLRTGPRGPGPGRQIFRGGILKKIEIEVWYAGKKGCPRERNLREIYTVCLVVPKQEDDHFPSGIAGIV